MLIGAILRFMGTNEIILGFVSIFGIVGFVLTVVVSIRTAKIGRILKYNQVASQYNKERKAYQSTFDGHRASIFEDGLRSDKLLKDILKNVEAYWAEFQEIISFRERVILFILKHHLLRKYRARVCTLTNRLSTPHEKSSQHKKRQAVPVAKSIEIRA